MKNAPYFKSNKFKEHLILGQIAIKATTAAFGATVAAGYAIHMIAQLKENKEIVSPLELKAQEPQSNTVTIDNTIYPLTNETSYIITLESDQSTVQQYSTR